MTGLIRNWQTCWSDHFCTVAVQRRQRPDSPQSGLSHLPRPASLWSMRDNWKPIDPIRADHDPVADDPWLMPLFPAPAPAPTPRHQWRLLFIAFLAIGGVAAAFLAYRSAASEKDASPQDSKGIIWLDNRLTPRSLP